jgi:hypothetical protein
VITTDELTDMMVAIYNHEYPGAELIAAALADQRDRALGHAAVEAPNVWLEKKPAEILRCWARRRRSAWAVGATLSPQP